MHHLILIVINRFIIGRRSTLTVRASWSTVSPLGSPPPLHRVLLYNEDAPEARAGKVNMLQRREISELRLQEKSWEKWTEIRKLQQLVDHSSKARSIIAAMKLSLPEDEHKNIAMQLRLWQERERIIRSDSSLSHQKQIPRLLQIPSDQI